MKPIIVSFASHGRENYTKGFLSLIRSVKEKKWDVDMLLYSFDGYIDEYLGVKIENGNHVFPRCEAFGACHNQEEIPYAFKLWLVQMARERGYKQIIWCDSTIRVNKYPTELLQQAHDAGLVTFDNMGIPFKNYISDAAINALQVSDEEMDAVPNIMACVLLWDFSNPKGEKIFNELYAASQDGWTFQNNGSDREGFIAHRHDQAALSVIAHRNGIVPNPYGGLCYRNIASEYPEHSFCNYGIV